ncbi:MULTISPECIES: hypothetical protein [Zobellia]|uniref:hypothetical protein n=1 Tax=Zobellia TaxID=112040 RepID=UPI001BFF9584|nr:MULTISPECIES: hypothetical protein [Zobellia]MBT9188293.1 hypothetical protein [Zobellia russellii]MBU2976521.1 hypothetical protein [Zobellia sp. B3R18]MDO6820895.1 hypothetical protein [Zobellia sp. 1_MG-2023]
MSTGVNKEEMKASESAPMPTKQKDDGSVRNQTTNVPRTRFPWVTIIMVIAFLMVFCVIYFVLDSAS